MIELLIAFLLLTGSLVAFVGAMGILRFRNLFSRMHAVTNVTSFSILLLLAALNIFALDWMVFIKSIIIFFVLINLSPMASFMLAKVSKQIENNRANRE
ncbi:MAG: monovalent cation/H(+) antiporter subunit G [Marinilabiliaceae bacterium]|nr:monovalent cation/H(+) antiporter subunit G [Marinilabiliaceae bacterium]